MAGASSTGMRQARPILLADDDAEFRGLLTLALTDAGYTVVPVGSGCAVADYLSATERSVAGVAPAGLVIADIRMPRGSGLQALKSVRTHDFRPPFILMTAFGSSETRREALRLGAVAVLDKPFELDRLVALTREVLWNAPVRW